ncbi:unnamed protein product, partial [Ectocarpus fasciculatus]
RLVGAIGTEFHINTYTLNSQSSADVVGLNDGGFMVVWNSAGQDGAGTGVYGQRYTASGFANGGEFRINTYTTSDQHAPRVDALTVGGVVVVWVSNGQDGDSSGIFGQRYAASGEKIGSEFRVNAFTSNSQAEPVIAGLSNGGYIVSWSSYYQSTGSWNDVYAKLYAANGTTDNVDILVNTNTASYREDPDVALLTGGGYVIVWEGYNQGGDSLGGIYAQRYLATGARDGSEFHVNTNTANEQRDSSVAAMSNGGFVIVWHSDQQDGSGNGIYGQRYTALGIKDGGEFRVNTYTTGEQHTTSVASLIDGVYVIIWTSVGQDGSDAGIYGQLYTPLGVKLRDEFRVNTYTSGGQSVGRISPLADGGFVVVWHSDGQDGSSNGIYGQRFDSNYDKIGLEI